MNIRKRLVVLLQELENVELESQLNDIFWGKVQTMSKKNTNGTNQGTFTGDVSVDRA